MADPYKTLGVEKTATEEDIRKAYKKLAKKHHPDLNPGDKAAEDRFKDISAAYALLNDPEKRRAFDAGEIDEQGQPKPERRGALHAACFSCRASLANAAPRPAA